LIEVNEDSIYLTELKLYINQYCIDFYNEIDDLKNYEITEHIYVPDIISTKVIKLNDDGMDAGRYGSVGLFGRPKQVAANISTPGKR